MKQTHTKLGRSPTRAIEYECTVHAPARGASKAQALLRLNGGSPCPLQFHHHRHRIVAVLLLLCCCGVVVIVLLWCCCRYRHIVAMSSSASCRGHVIVAVALWPSSLDRCGVVVAVLSSSCHHCVVVIVGSSRCHLYHRIMAVSSLPSCRRCLCCRIIVVSSLSRRYYVVVVVALLLLLLSLSVLLLSSSLPSCYCCRRHQCIFLSSVYERHCQGIPKPGGGLDWYLPTVFLSCPFNVIRSRQILLIASLGGTQECLVTYLKYSSGAVRYIHILE